MTKVDAPTSNSRLGPRTLGLMAAVALVGLVAGPMAAPVAGHAGADDVKITARESGCPEGRDFCFEVTTGDISKVSDGDTLDITLANPSDNDLAHNLHIAMLSEADVGGNTDEGAAEKNTDNVEPGGTASLQMQVPSGSDGVYLWCDVGAHETRGMYLEVPTGSTSDGDASSDGQNSSPGFGTAAGLIALAGLAVAWRRR